MGMDVFVNGELTIPANKVLEAGKLLLVALPEYAELVQTPDGVCELIRENLQKFDLTKEDDGSLSFGVHDCCRHEDEDQWLFQALAPVIDDGELYMSGDDYRWKWVIEDGEFSESYGETVYDYDRNLETTLDRIIALIYPDALGGQPASAVPPEERKGGPDDTDIVFQIENLLRESGYGPQAGKNELERLADV